MKYLISLLLFITSLTLIVTGQVHSQTIDLRLLTARPGLLRRDLDPTGWEMPHYFTLE